MGVMYIWTTHGRGPTDQWFTLSLTLETQIPRDPGPDPPPNPQLSQRQIRRPTGKTNLSKAMGDSMEDLSALDFERRIIVRAV